MQSNCLLFSLEEFQSIYPSDSIGWLVHLLTKQFRMYREVGGLCESDIWTKDLVWLKWSLARLIDWAGFVACVCLFVCLFLSGWLRDLMINWLMDRWFNERWPKLESGREYCKSNLFLSCYYYPFFLISFFFQIWSLSFLTVCSQTNSIFSLILPLDRIWVGRSVHNKFTGKSASAHKHI